jgi:lipopolysaccharide transport system ATP-binding protein
MSSEGRLNVPRFSSLEESVWDEAAEERHEQSQVPSIRAGESPDERVSTDVAICASNLSKCYHIYDRPQDRLKQSLVPRFQRLIGRPQTQYAREFWALKDVSLEVKKGETVGIVGRNGSGKSTLLQIICGTLSPTSGTIKTNGRITALLELGSGFNPEFTGRENVYMNGAVLGLSREEIDARFDAIAAFADIGQFMDQPVKMYSSGMVVRLAFSVAINVDPWILVVDEALAVGDELFQRKCFSRIEAIKDNGATILFVSHSGSAVVELSDRAILLDSGEALMVGVPKIAVSMYQKLLYAPPDKREEVRRAVRIGVTSGADDLTQRPVRHTTLTEEGKTEANDIEEFSDPHLLPLSRFEFASHGARIEIPAIRTLQGREVNNLVRGRRYRYTYRVRFTRPASGVRFGMLIKTTSGLPLGGALSAASLPDAIPYISADACVLVQFTFECRLNPGVYFLNAGVFGIVSGEETVLHRIVDAIAIRVLPVERNLVTELIDFEFVPEITFDA